MPGEPYEFPLTARPFLLLLAFLVCLLLFHFFLVKLFPLGRLGWKIADYIWLAVSVLALVGAALGVRHLLAKGQIDTRIAQVASAYADLRREAEFLTSPAVCRTFFRSEPQSPQFALVQRNYDAICGYGRVLVASLPAAPPPHPSSLSWPVRPQVTEQPLADMLDNLDRANVIYRRAAQTLETLRHEAQTGEADLGLALISPFFLMLALALRITKVTGEILLDRPRRAS